MVDKGHQAPHPIVATTRKLIAGRSSGSEAFLYIGYRGGAIKMRVSPASAERALLLMDALFKLAEKRGYKVGLSGDTYGGGAYVEVDGETIEIEVQERLLKGEGKPGGRLRIIMGAHWGGQTNWDEGGRWRHESRLERLLEGIATAARHKKVVWDERRKEEAKREQERRSEEEAARVRAEEQERGEFLQEQVRVWRLAVEIRQFVREVGKASGVVNGSSARGELKAWLSWASNYADGIDPVRKANRGSLRLSATPE